MLELNYGFNRNFWYSKKLRIVLIFLRFLTRHYLTAVSGSTTNLLKFLKFLKFLTF